MDQIFLSLSIHRLAGRGQESVRITEAGLGEYSGCIARGEPEIYEDRQGRSEGRSGSIG